MPKIPVYQQQVGIRASGPSPVHTPTQTTDSMMLQQGVNSFADAYVRLSQQQQAVKNTQYMTDFVNSQSALSQSLNDAQQKSRTGIDYIPASQEIIKQHQEDFFSQHPDLTDQEKDDYNLRWAQARGQIENQAINWGQNQAKRIQVANLADSASAIGSAILQDPNTAKSLAAAHLQAIDQTNLDPATKAELESQSRNMWALSAAQYGIRQDPQHVIDQHGTFQAVQSMGAGDGSGSPSGSSGTLATRNNNPLNIRFSDKNQWVGKSGNNVSGFEQFDTADHGFRAGIKLMRNHINHGSDTLASLISKWAPTGDNNDPVQYAQAVSKQTGIPVDAKLNPDDPQQMSAVAKAMAKQEGYGAPISDTQLNRAWSSQDDPNQLAPGVPWGQLTPQQTNTILNQAQAAIDRQRAQALAEQNRAEMLAARRENAASHASDIMQTRIANGEIPSDDDWQNYASTIEGTGYAGGDQVMRAALVATQKLYSLPPQQAQQEVDRMSLELKQHGGSEMQYKVLAAVQRNVDQRRSDIQKNPQAVGALDSGQPLQPLNVSDAIDQPGVWGQGLLQRQVNSDAIANKYGPTAGKNLLTPDELHNAQDAYARMGSDQRIQFWRNTQASSSPAIATRLAREVGGDSLQVAAVANLANTPSGYAAALAVDRGNRLMNPVDGAAKVKFGPSFDDDTMAEIKSEYPGLSVSQIQQILPVVKAYHAGSGGDLTRRPDRDSLHNIIGTPVKIGSATIIAPPGTDENAYKDNISNGIKRLGEYAQSVNNGLRNGVYTLTPDIDGNQILINAASQRKVIGDDGRPVVIEVSK